VDFHVVPSSNHASVSERLPFIAVNATDPAPFKRTAVISSNELAHWAVELEDSWPRELDTLYESYSSLLDNEIRRIWVRRLLPRKMREGERD
jgi:hypothetical protein